MMRRLGMMGLVLAILGGATVRLPGRTVAADGPWFGPDEPVLTHYPLDPARHTARATAALAGRPSETCTPHAVAIGGYGGEDRSIESCWFTTAIGLLNDTGEYIRPEGQPLGGRPPIGSRLIPTASSAIGIEEMDGRIRFWTSPTALRPVTQADGSLRYAWAEAPAAELRTETGSWLAGDSFQGGHLFYSEDHEWAAAWHSDGLALVIHLTDLTIRTVRLADGAQSTGVSLAISNGGHYLAASRSSANRELIALDGCAPARRAVIQPVTCPTRQFNRLPASRTTNTYPELPRFYGQYRLAFAIETSDRQREEYMVRAAGSPAQAYTALGDSFASGEGADDYITRTDVPGTNMCHTSKSSYPFVVAASAGTISARSVACSGARLRHITTAAQWPHPPPDNTIGSGLPGLRPQVAYLSDAPDDAISLSVIGNDIGFANKLKRCLEPDACYASFEDRLELLREINRQFDPLKRLYAEIQRAAPASRLFVVGYPSVVASKTLCVGWQPAGFSAAEADFANALTSSLNTLIRQAASASGASYVDVETALKDHRLCEASGSEAGINGITRGDDTLPLPALGPILSNNSFHPTARGHQLLAAAIAAQTDDLTRSRPLPDPLVGPPAEIGQALLDAPAAGRPVKEINYDEDLANNVIYRGGLWRLVYNAGQIGLRLKPDSLVQAWIHSEPRHLTTLTADAGGELRADISLPADLSEGFHTLHLYATAADGRAIDIYKTVFVSAAEAQPAASRPPGASGNATDVLPGRLATTGSSLWPVPVALLLVTAALTTWRAGKRARRYVRR